MSLRVLILMGSFLSLGGCVAGVVGAAGAIGVSSLQDRTLGESVDDATAGGEVKAKLLRAGLTRFGEVDVEVADRLLLLSGRVSTPEDRIEAENIAWSVGMVHRVVNEIQVREKGGVKQNLNDEWITARVRSRLFTDGSVKSVNINIETYDGTVYLMGIARNEPELLRIVEHASLVSGVKEVVTYIQIRDTAAPTAAAPVTTADTQPAESTELFNPYSTSGSN